MLKNWIRMGIERGASDVHLEAGTPIVFRMNGELNAVGEVIKSEELNDAVKTLLGAEHWQSFLSKRSADLSKTLVGTRCRIHAFQTARGLGLAIRLLSSFQNTIKDCNLHPDFKKWIEAKTGLIVLSGPTGSGKSTTMAALIEEINRTQRRQVLTIESPIEYFFSNRQSFIRQREVQSHTPSFEQAITDAMRENPDVLVIGEMRTPDVMRLTLNAAETGHLVLATMHSSTSAEALARICMSFPSDIQSSVRAQLADCLNAVICQRLSLVPKFQIRVPCCEVLIASTSVKSHLRAGQFSQLISAIQTGGEEGMWSFDRYQKWIDQKKDWVRPSQATPLEPRPEPSFSFYSEKDSVKSTATKISPSSKAIGLAPVSATPSSGDRIEIAPVVDDLEELAKKIGDDENQ